ncbi:MAG: hypothetical protein ACLFR1_15495 [Spirochaetia bacterium]
MKRKSVLKKPANQNTPVTTAAAYPFVPGTLGCSVIICKSSIAPSDELI